MLNPSVRQHVKRTLGPPEDRHGDASPLAEDAQRLCRRSLRFKGVMGITEKLDVEALELACWALQLPRKQAAQVNPPAGKTGPGKTTAGKTPPGKTAAGKLASGKVVGGKAASGGVSAVAATPAGLRSRAEAAAELLMTTWAEHIPTDLLDRAHRILLEVPQKQPEAAEARLLAEAVDFEDFGLLGILNAAMQTAQQGKSAAHVVQSYRRRDEYGYWQARLKEGEGHPALRELKLARLQQARRMINALEKELEEDAAE